MNDAADKLSFATVVQALGALEWTLVRIVFNVRARTAVGFQQYLANAGIDIPESIIKSPKWFGAFRRAPSVANHRDGFGGLLRDRLIALRFDEDVVRDAMEGLEKDVLELCLDVQSAVAHELRRDLQAVGVHVAASILDSGKWRDVFVREQGELPPGAASIVRDGTDSSIFRAVEGSKEATIRRCGASGQRVAPYSD